VVYITILEAKYFSQVPVVFRKISQDIKEHTLYLLDNDYITEDVCDIFDVSSHSLS
jgi:hypothetical protein